MSTIVTISMPSEAAAKLADPEVQAKLKAALAAEGIPMESIIPTIPVLKPCPKCGSAKVKFSNCGYSSFDVATAECECGHKIVVSCSSDARPDWNAYFYDEESRFFYHWLMESEGSRNSRSLEQIVDKAAELFRGHSGAK